MKPSNKEIKLRRIGKYCRNFRVNELQLTLKQLADKTHRNAKTISSFENGRSSNVMMLIDVYIIACPDNGYKLGFVQGLNDIMIRK